MLRVFRSGIGFLKKAFLVFAVFFIIFAIFGYVINGNRPKYDEKKVLQASQKQLYDTLSREKLGIKKGSGKDLLLTLYRMGYCTVIGELCTEKLTYDTNAFKSSLIGRVSGMISMTYTNPPASGVYWVTNTLQNAGFIPQSYAAEGMGFTMIKPLMNLWKIFRDIAYLVIVVVLIAVGFMIMFRTKINPQTVITVENSLPKIVIALLLITFSFAIAGFLIDLMYLLIVLAIGILSNNNTYFDAGKMQNTYLQSNLWTLWGNIIPLPPDVKGLIGLPKFGYVGDAFMALVPEEINLTFHGIAATAGVWLAVHGILQFLVSSGIMSFADNWLLAGFGVGKTPSALFSTILLPVFVIIAINLVIHGLGFIIGFIVSLAIFGMVWNIFFMLLKSYIQITISIVFSPIILLFEALPGNNNFSFWVKGLLGELLTFPVVITLLLVEKVMFMTMTYPGEFWTPPFMMNLNPGTFSLIFGLGLILITPDIVKLVKEGIGAKPLPFNIGVGTFFGGGGAVLGGGMGILQQFSTINLGLQGMGALAGRFTGRGKAAEEAEKKAAAARTTSIPLASDATKNPS
jgi:hypothetical protein